MDIQRARELARASLQTLEANKRRIDDLNVYPVPDGDTGTNLTATVRAVVEALEKSTAEGQEAIAKELSRAALFGASGNSGVIFSQIVRGFADVLAQHEEVDGPVLAAAFRSASDAAYRAVRKPVEGTMLTVVREMAEEAELPDVRTLPKDELLRRVVARGEQAVARTPELLDVLRDAGVVDAGGAGLLEIVRGLAAGVAGEPIPDAPVDSEDLSFDAVHLELSQYRYCTVFVVEGEDLDADDLETELDKLGDSLLVVGDSTALKVHIHTDEPGVALTHGTRVGTIEGVTIANMHVQTEQREERLSTPGATIPVLATGLVAVVPGVGNRALFESEGVTRIVEGGQTMNPSTADIVTAVDAVPAPDVFVLPNNKNVVLSAEQAVGLSTKRVRVIPSVSVPQGLAAAIAYDPTSSPDANEAAMREAISMVATGEVTVASRDVSIDGVEVRKGEWLGLVEGRVVVCARDLEAVTATVVEYLLGDGTRGLITVLVGDGGPDLQELRTQLKARHPMVDVDVHSGGQPHYPLLIAAE